MTFTDRGWKLAAGGAVLFIAGVGTAWLLRPGSSQMTDPASSPAPASPRPASAVVVEISEEVARRAGFEEATVVSQSVSAETRIPGTVEPHGYRVVAVTAPAGGRVIRVGPELGDPVARGSVLVVMHSPELAKAASDHAAAVAALNAVERDLDRTRRLVAIGAASRRELEAREAERADAVARVEAAQAEVRLLGGRSSRSGEMTVRAESPGVVIERMANSGVVVERGAPLVTTAPLSPVWVIGELSEADMGRVRVGDRAIISAGAYPGLNVAGRVTYIAPQVRRDTRTAQIRIETPNEGGRLRFGMVVEARIEAERADGATLAVPSSAIQRIGAATVVYVVQPGSHTRFEERRVEVGPERGGMTQIRSGLREGERVVSRGSFFLRAEAERQGLRPAGLPATPPPESAADAAPRERVIPITVDGMTFKPSRVELRQGETVVLRFTRVSDSCGTEVVVPPAPEKHALPLNQPVDIRFTASKPGEHTFACGMDMMKGTIVVQ